VPAAIQHTFGDFNYKGEATDSCALVPLRAPRCHDLISSLVDDAVEPAGIVQGVSIYI